MSNDLNQVTLLGRLGSDGELRYLGGFGRCVLNMSLATSESWWDSKESQTKTKTQWHKVAWWGPEAEKFAKKAVKGTQLCIEGKIEYSNWEDKEGVRRYKTEIVVRKCVVVSEVANPKQEDPEPTDFSDMEEVQEP